MLMGLVRVVVSLFEMGFADSVLLTIARDSSWYSDDEVEMKDGVVASLPICLYTSSPHSLSFQLHHHSACQRRTRRKQRQSQPQELGHSGD